MATTRGDHGAGGANAEAIRAWDGPLYERFVRFREVLTTGLGHHGDEALRLQAPAPGHRVLDLGCGFGDTTVKIAAMVGPDGLAVGLDASPRFVEAARREAAEAGVAVERPEQHDEPTCGPGPFSMADADTTSHVLVLAGFAGITLRRCDLPILMGRDMDEAIDLVMALGPAGELLRLAGERAAHLHDDVRAALRTGLEGFAGPDGVRAPASTWIVSARAPER